MLWKRAIHIGKNFWRRFEPFARSTSKSRSYAQYVAVAQFMMIAGFVTIAFTAKFAARMIRWEL
jgi:hypothetical protein